MINDEFNTNKFGDDEMAKYVDVSREAYRMVDETCPKVDEALITAANKIKEQTQLLREALFQALERAIDAEEKISELESEIKTLKERLEV